ncbi:hypothetical protein SDC9_187687 [bioreactor metagenome]|uniref:Uncharacterized protein n=1 Tax=bioreactor metagenome TaxID=1076179 RepID=A0A645HM77_9ZZZZ
MCERFIQHLGNGFEFPFGHIDRRKLDRRADVVHVIVNNHRVVAFFLRLDIKPVCEAFKVLRLEIGRHRKVKVRGIQFLVNLLVQ